MSLTNMAASQFVRSNFKEFRNENKAGQKYFHSESRNMKYGQRVLEDLSSMFSFLARWRLAKTLSGDFSDLFVSTSSMHLCGILFVYTIKYHFFPGKYFTNLNCLISLITRHLEWPNSHYTDELSAILEDNSSIIE